MKLKHKFNTDYITTAVVRGSGAAATFVVTFLVAKFYSINDAASFYFFWNIINLLAVFATFGASAKVIKSVSLSTSVDNSNTIYTNSSLICVFFHFSLFFLLIFTSFLFDFSLDLNYLLLFFVSSLFFSLIQITGFYGFGLGKTNLAAFSQSLLHMLFFSMLFVIVTYFYSSITLLKFSLFFSFLVSYILCAFLIFKVKFLFVGKNDFFTFFKASIPFALVSFFTLFIQNSSSYFIYYLSSADVYSNYNMSHRIAYISSFLLVIFNSVFSRKFARLHSEGLLDSDYLFVLFRKVIYVAFCFSLILLIFGYFSVGLLAVEYNDSFYFLSIMIVGNYFSVVFGVFLLYFNMTGGEFFYLKVTIFTVLLGTFISYLLWLVLGHYGLVVGYSVMMTLPGLIAFIRYLYINNRIFKVI